MANSKYRWYRFLANLCVILGFISLIITIWLLKVDDKIHWLTPLDLEKASKIGDFVGGFISIFWTIAGIILLYVTLQTQIDEFSNTQKAIAKQQFETTFFNMLSVLLEIKNSIKGRISYSHHKTKKQISQTFSSQQFLHNGLKEFKSRYHAKLKKDENQSAAAIEKIEEKVRKNIPISTLEFNILKEILDDSYIDFYDRHHSELGHYFRYIYNLIKFTIEARESENDESMYINLVQAQLTNDELSLIFYNAISKNGLNQQKRPQFYEWLEKYNFLENMDERSLLRREHHVLFPNTIFKFLNLDERSQKRKSAPNTVESVHTAGK